MPPAARPGAPAAAGAMAVELPLLLGCSIPKALPSCSHAAPAEVAASCGTEANASCITEGDHLRSWQRRRLLADYEYQVRRGATRAPVGHMSYIRTAAQQGASLKSDRP